MTITIDIFAYTMLALPGSASADNREARFCQHLGLGALRGVLWLWPLGWLMGLVPGASS